MKEKPFKAWDFQGLSQTGVYKGADGKVHVVVFGIECEDCKYVEYTRKDELGREWPGCQRVDACYSHSPYF